MPYIDDDKRRDYKIPLFQLVARLRYTEDDKIAGDLNYLITNLLMFGYRDENYSNYNAMLGVLESVKQEIYRRKVAAYEEKKIKLNGDIDCMTETNDE